MKYLMVAILLFVIAACCPYPVMKGGKIEIDSSGNPKWESTLSRSKAMKNIKEAMKAEGIVFHKKRSGNWINEVIFQALMVLGGILIAFGIIICVWRDFFKGIMIMITGVALNAAGWLLLEYGWLLLVLAVLVLIYAILHLMKKKGMFNAVLSTVNHLKENVSDKWNENVDTIKEKQGKYQQDISKEAKRMFK